MFKEISLSLFWQIWGALRKAAYGVNAAAAAAAILEHARREASAATCSNMSTRKEFTMDMALAEIPMSG